MNAARMPAWDDKQISRFNFRNALFARRGLAADAAEKLADTLAFRDFDRDERRICLECSSWQKSRTCFKRLPFLPTLFQRCAGFQFQTP